ncbi:septal ring lytic transglycosylase RlpA family protein [Marinomonas balearica]|uniref:Endolytic peptidoglycan transglycosylase RlpA n=1 Tax=Marinomonas balearica TaxID=491947 RepID=A0A4R6MHM1_9GAMM|nr:septal ring lytic transglycosylase RlpA family protein [Marinomonas balearica]TDO99669.1 rare lipoprotein A [Marinomonas balearica]
MGCNRLLIVVIALLMLSGCMSSKHINGNSASTVDLDKASGGGRYSILQDHGPSSDVKVDHLPDLVPKWEPKSRGGNKSPYVVWGEKYYVMKSAEGYKAQGTASWYGKKFHGHKTSNGETYDMYAFSAAHKNLPLPTYLKVTNIDNGRSVIVRVNDRGPFHGDRLIDLSYAAAVRLDYHKKGLARVKVEAITPKQGQSSSVKSTKNAAVTQPIVKTNFSHLQLGAFSAQDSAESLKNSLIEHFDTQISVQVRADSSGLYKVLVGPYNSSDALTKWQAKLENAGFAKSVKVALSP